MANGKSVATIFAAPGPNLSAIAVAIWGPKWLTIAFFSNRLKFEFIAAVPEFLPEIFEGKGKEKWNPQ
jgi:hypothetical protein